MLQRARIFKVYCCLKVHNAHNLNYYRQFQDAFHEQKAIIFQLIDIIENVESSSIDVV